MLFIPVFGKSGIIGNLYNKNAEKNIIIIFNKKSGQNNTVNNIINKRSNGDNDIIINDVRHEFLSLFPPFSPPPLIPATIPVVRPAKIKFTKIPKPDHKPNITPNDGPVNYI